MISRSLHIIIALTLLLSTTGVTVTAYFCNDSLSGLSLLSPKECSSITKACCLLSTSKKKCCTSDSEYIKIDIEQQVLKFGDFEDVEIEQALAVEDFFRQNNPSSPKEKVVRLYRPPPLIKDFPSLFQVFLC